MLRQSDIININYYSKLKFEIDENNQTLIILEHKVPIMFIVCITFGLKTDV